MAKKTAGIEVSRPKTKTKVARVRQASKASRIEMVRQLIETLSETVRTDGKGVAELIRLLSLEKELSEGNEAVKEIKVTWVEPITTES